MSDGSSGGLRLTKGSGTKVSKNERREAAREKARDLRDRHRKKEKRTRYLLQGGIILAVVAAVAVVAMIITSSVRPPASGPRNMLSDGIVIGTDFTAATTPGLDAGAEPVATPANPEVLAISVYLDYLCPNCGAFEKANSEQIATLVDQGVATVEIHPVAILDRVSQGSRYSTRAANAAACVAEYSPNSFFDFNSAMFADQPDENTTGLTDDELISIAKSAGVAQRSKVASCIEALDFEQWVEDSTGRAVDDPDLQGAQGFATPAIFVNGTMFTGNVADPTEFAQFIASADGEASAVESTETPPLPPPAPTP